MILFIMPLSKYTILLVSCLTLLRIISVVLQITLFEYLKTLQEGRLYI